MPIEFSAPDATVNCRLRLSYAQDDNGPTPSAVVPCMRAVCTGDENGKHNRCRGNLEGAGKLLTKHGGLFRLGCSALAEVVRALRRTIDTRAVR